MDHSKTKHLSVEGRSLDPEPDVKPVWKQEIEDTMELAERALSARRPSTSEDSEVTARRYFQIGTAARAPLQERAEVQPSRVDRTDGSVSLESPGLQDRLETRARELFSTDVTANVSFEIEDRPIRIVYTFAEPITGIENFDGRMYSVAQRGREIPFVAGTPVKRLTQVINASEFPADAPVKEMNLEVTSKTNVVRWTKNTGE